MADNRFAAARTFFVGGLLPVIAFAVVEELYGAKGGLIAGMLFGVGEMAWEYRQLGRIQGLTIGSNALVLILGILSLYEENPVFFKLQPAIFLLIMTVMILGSTLIKKPLLIALARKQNPTLPDLAEKRLAGMNWRIGVLFLFLTLVSVHSAYAWPTAAWAAFKGIGIPAALFAYMGVEILVARRKR